MSGGETAPSRTGIIAWPVGHSRSPLIHNSWIKAHGLKAIYERCPIDPETDFRAALLAMAEDGFIGANVTLPHKENAFRAMDKLTPAAQKLGAVNTISFKDGKLYGANTDGAGFMASLDDAAPAHKWREEPVIILGAGGAARALIVAMGEAGVQDIRLTNRTRARAEALVDLGEGRVSIGDWEARADLADGCGLLVNTTSLGMGGAAPLDMDLARLDKNALVSDIVYTPLETDLLTHAKTAGFTAVDGLGMLLHQAAFSFYIWFGVHPKIDAKLRDAVIEDLNEN